MGVFLAKHAKGRGRPGNCFSQQAQRSGGSGSLIRIFSSPFVANLFPRCRKVSGAADAALLCFAEHAKGRERESPH